MAVTKTGPGIAVNGFRVGGIASIRQSAGESKTANATGATNSKGNKRKK